MFLEAQGVVLKENILYQDNQSAIKIEKNGKSSGGQKTKHMDARYFFIKDRLSTEGIEVRYCPTEKMIADFFTKPLQGSLFRKFRDIVLGYKHIDTLLEDTECPSDQERVEKNISEFSMGSEKDTSVVPGPHKTKMTNVVKPTEGSTEGRNDIETERNDSKKKERNVSFFLNNPD
jgi:hypothetical protein